MSDNLVLPNSPNVYGPITPSQMFERTFGLLRQDPKLFFGIAAVLMGFEIVIGGVLGGSGLWMAHSSVGAVPITRILVTIPLALLGALMIYVFTQVIQGALFLATQAKLTNTSMSVGEACQIAGVNVGRLVGISLLVALRMFGYMLLFYLVLGLPLLVIALIPGVARLGGNTASRFGHATSPALVVFFAILILAFFALYVLAMLWLFARYAVSIPAGLAENVSITEAIRRSIHLTRGSKGRLYALFTGVFAIYVVIAACTFPVLLIVAHGSILHGGMAPTKNGGIIMMLLNLIEYMIGAVVLTFVGIGTALCYYDLRVRKEGFGTESSAPALDFRPAIPPSTPDWPIEDLPVS